MKIESFHDINEYLTKEIYEQLSEKDKELLYQTGLKGFKNEYGEHEYGKLYPSFSAYSFGESKRNSNDISDILLDHIDNTPFYEQYKLNEIAPAVLNMCESFEDINEFLKPEIYYFFREKNINLIIKKGRMGFNNQRGHLKKTGEEQFFMESYFINEKFLTLFDKCNDEETLNKNIPELLELCESFKDINLFLENHIYDTLTDENKILINERGRKGFNRNPGYLFCRKGLRFFMADKKHKS